DRIPGRGTARPGPRIVPPGRARAQHLPPRQQYEEPKVSRSANPDVPGTRPSPVAPRQAGRPVFPLHHETARAIRRDLEAAGIPYATDEGKADFHSLRAYYISAFVRSGASIAEVRKLARHAKSETTLKHYAKVAPHDLRRAVESLPVAPATG